MRLLIPLLLLFALHSAGFSQAAAPSPSGGAGAVTIDPRLFAAFDAAYLERLRAENPTVLQRWNFYLDHAFTIGDYPPEKGDPAQFPEVQIADPAQVNILVVEKTQRLARDWERPTFYRIAGTNKVLMYWSGKEFNRKFQAWLNR